MAVYVDSSALAKLYLDEPERAVVSQALTSLEGQPVTSGLTAIEVRRVIARVESASERVTARMLFLSDFEACDVVALDAALVEPAAVIAEQLGVRTLDAIHLASAVRSGCDTLVSFDIRQREAARALGLDVIPP